MGNTPSLIELLAGSHTVRVDAKGQKSWSRVVSLTAGSKVSIQAVLSSAASQCTDEMNDDLETLKCRLRFVISFRATALSIGTHSVTTQKFA
jgi:hypothetical protein